MRVINTPDGMPVSNGNPLPVKVVGGGGDGGTTENVNIQNWPETQKVSVQNPAKTVAVGNIIGGTVDPESQPKLIEAAGAEAIEIQCPQDNTGPLLVSNMEMDFGDWEVYPGTSKTFYFNNLYVRTNATEQQRVVFMAWSKG